MKGICKRLSPECILLDLEAEDKLSIIRHLVLALDATHDLPDAQRIIDDVMAREKLASTCLGSGCAVPHAHSVGLESSYIAATRLAQPIELDTPDGEPVSLIFLLIGPPKHAATHLKLLSKLARLLHDSDFRDKLKHTESVDGFLTILCNEEE
jgi:mannitol/fructose-specific phosphotransferase system IIA component (Ntr-type)